jgi:energy-converting hydrogenase Eha subunit C
MDGMKFQSLFSRTIGQIVLGVAGVMYANQLWASPLDKVVAIGLLAFGAIAVLSALCFTMAPCLTTEEERYPTLYAGEKFFHSSLLLIQTIFLKYAGESLLNVQFVANVSWLHRSIGITINIAASLTGAVATWFSIYGFQSLNEFFWQRYERRRANIQIRKKS